MRILLALLIASAPLLAEEVGHTLDPAKPEQALAIIVQLTQNAQMTAHDAWVLKAAIDTLDRIVQERATAAHSATGAAVK